MRKRLTQSAETLDTLSEVMLCYAGAQADPQNSDLADLPDLDAKLQAHLEQYVTHAQLRGHLEETGRAAEVRGSGAAIELF